MATATDSPEVYPLPDGLAAEIQALGEAVGQFQHGLLEPADFRARHVPLGIYEQRESGQFMLRVRLPGGVLPPGQMRALAAVSQRYGNGVLHLTTRQDIQVHRVPLDCLCDALEALGRAGLRTRGGGGDTVRNITACPRTGVCRDQVFDVAPYVVAVTEFLLADPASFQLPRKYKLAFSGCERDCAGVAVHDVGFLATRQDGAEGFRAFAGGGLGALSRVGQVLEEFVSAGDAGLVAEAVKRVFHRHGNRQNRRRARLRFLVEERGWEEFVRLYREELRELRASSPPPLALRPPAGQPDRPIRLEAQPPVGAAEPAEGEAEWETWRRRNVTAQAQNGYAVVGIPLPLGDVPAAILAALAEVVEAHGEGALRTDQAQNAALRWVQEVELGAVYGKLAALGLARAEPPVLRDLVPCTGAGTCRLGLCLSRGLAEAVAERLRASDLDLAALSELKVHISGCPNACGRHPVAQVGLCGAAPRVKGRPVPSYSVHLGGRTAARDTRLAAAAGRLPARNVPAFLTDLLRAFGQSPCCPDFEAFLAQGGHQAAAGLVAAHGHVPDFDQDPTCYCDWGADEPWGAIGGE